MTTNAGRALLDDEMHQRLLLVIGEKADTTEDDVAAAIAAIEAEKEAEVRARLAAEVKALPSEFSDPDGQLDYDPDWVDRAAVIALIQPEGAKAEPRLFCSTCGTEHGPECRWDAEGAKA